MVRDDVETAELPRLARRGRDGDVWRALTKDRRKFLGVCGVVGGVLQVVQQAQR